MSPKWHRRDKLPFNQMWSGDKKWLPIILSGKTIEAEARFDKEGKALLGFEYKEVSF